jgi:hypothetical protein
MKKIMINNYSKIFKFTKRMMMIKYNKSNNYTKRVNKHKIKKNIYWFNKSQYGITILIIIIM